MTEEVSEELLLQFRAELEKKGDTNSHSHLDSELKRFLVARKLDLNHATKMYLDYLEWKRVNKIDEIVINPDGPIPCPIRGFTRIKDQNPIPQNKNEGKFYQYLGGNSFHKTDKQGHPLFIERTGLTNAKKFGKHVTVETILDLHIKSQVMLTNYLLPECAEKAGKEIETVTMVMDLTGLGFHQFYIPALKLLKAISDLDQANYPERLHRMYWVNAPKIFSIFFDFGKAWVDERILSKFRILTPQETPAALLEDIDPENLPEYLGGTCKCEHMLGGCVPSIDDQITEPQFSNTSTVPPRSYLDIEIVFTQDGTNVIKYTFQTKHYDIGFGIFKKEDADLKELLPIQLHNSHEEVIQEIFPVPTKGTYICRFDNSHSKMRGKELSYTIEQTSIDPSSEDLH